MRQQVTLPWQTSQMWGREGAIHPGAFARLVHPPKGPLRIELLAFQPEPQQKAKRTRFEKYSVVSPGKGGLPP